MGFQFLFFQVLGFFSVRGPVANRSFRNVVVVFFFFFFVFVFVLLRLHH